MGHASESELNGLNGLQNCHEIQVELFVNYLSKLNENVISHYTDTKNDLKHVLKLQKCLKSTVSFFTQNHIMKIKGICESK